MRSPYPRPSVRERETIAYERMNVMASYRGWTMALFTFASVAVVTVPAFGWIAVFPGLFSVLLFFGRSSSQATLLALKGLGWSDVPSKAKYGLWLDWYERAVDRYPYSDGAEIGDLPP